MPFWYLWLVFLIPWPLQIKGQGFGYVGIKLYRFAHFTEANHVKPVIVSRCRNEASQLCALAISVSRKNMGAAHFIRQVLRDDFPLADLGPAVPQRSSPTQILLGTFFIRINQLRIAGRPAYQSRPVRSLSARSCPHNYIFMRKFSGSYTWDAWRIASTSVPRTRKVQAPSMGNVPAFTYPSTKSFPVR